MQKIERKVKPMENENVSITADETAAATAETPTEEKQPENADETKPAESTKSEPAAESKSESEDKTAASEPEQPQAAAEEKQPERFDKTENAEKLTELEGKVHALAAGIKSDCLDDVIALAKTKVNAETTIESAIDAIVEKYPQFKDNAVEIAVTTAAHTSNDSAVALDEAKVNRIMGIK